MSILQVASGLDALLGGLPTGDVAVVRDRDTWVIGVRPAAVIRTSGAEALAALDRLDKGWWAGCLAYDLGRAIERVPNTAASLPLPDLALARYDARLRLDPSGDISIEGDGPARAELERIADAAPSDLEVEPIHEWRTSIDRPAWDEAVRTILGHLRAGDCYQVNLTRRLQCETPADPLALFRALVSEHPAPHAALIRIGDIAIVSASPERFLRRDGRRVETRPIKGTSSSAEALAASEKDRAENVMIVDLARNDLGRVCEYGTVHVPALCSIEQHPGLYHLVSTIAGTLRPDVSVGDIVRATFPPASVTGCPKPRVLEIIESLEPVRRGIYCGAVGFIDADNDVLDLNVAIRTFTIADGMTSFGVGGGIVADSDPGAEWAETELKARRLLAIAGGVG